MPVANKTDQIIDAAKATFLTIGYRATSMDQVAERAGVTKRTIYNNFTSKEQLLEAVIEGTLARLGDRLAPLPPDAGQAKLLRFAETLIELTCWDGAIGVQRLLIAEADTFPGLGTRLVTVSGEIMERPVAAWLAARGHRAAQTASLAREWINRLTAPARLDRLLGRRRPYPREPGDNTLDAADRTAARDAVSYLLGLS
jgi:TetR/AcrR family transcriptional repressor of mexJK operon